MIVNKNAIFSHINNYQLKAAASEIEREMGSTPLQIAITAAQNTAINTAQTNKGKAELQHIKLAVLGNFAEGKALNPDDPKLLRATSFIVAKYAEIEFGMDGFIQVKGAPKMVDAAIKVAVKSQPKQADTAEKEQDETVDTAAEQIEPKQTKKGKKETASLEAGQA